jgi:hypothetical protein
MPRGGSKKGEHRGNARKRDGIEKPADIMRSAVRNGQSPGQRGSDKAMIEEDVLMSQIVHGRLSAYDMTPKEIMLDNMHHFQQAAYISKAMSEMLLRVAPSEERSRQLRQLELDEERLRMIASDRAERVAPFIHPRLAAIVAAGGGNIGKNIVRTMLDEIDRLNREHPMVIEHQPQKRTA